MEISVILPHVEALVFASEKPLTSLELTELINNALGFLDDKITLDQIETAVQGVIEKYNSDFYPFEIRESGGGWQFLTKKDYHKTVAQLNGDKFLKRLSSASLESLAIIAYKQPITKGEVESIRGVNSDYSIQKLLDKELIVITGRNEEMPGKPLVYATSRTFMDYFGINTAEELPMIREILSSQPFSATPVPQPKGDGLFKDNPVDEEPSSMSFEDNDPLVVRANGELIEEPSVVVDEITEVVEPEQVIDSEESIEESVEDDTQESSEEELEDSEEEASEELSEEETEESIEGEVEQFPEEENEETEESTEGEVEQFPEEENEETPDEELEESPEEENEETLVQSPDEVIEESSEADVDESPEALQNPEDSESKQSNKED